MALTLYPYKLLPGEMEGRLVGAAGVHPGQWLQGHGGNHAPDSRWIAQVTAVRTVPAELQDGDRNALTTADSEGAQLIRLRIVQGTSALAPQTARVMDEPAFLVEAQRAQKSVEHPVQLGQLTGDFFKVGTLTLIDGDSLDARFEALHLLGSGLSPYQKLVLIDPTGVVTESEAVRVLGVGEGLQLSLQAVGSKSFLETFAGLLPAPLREAGLRTVASLLPVTQAFTPFQQLLSLENFSDAPLRNLVLQHLHQLADCGLFADSPEAVLDAASLLNSDALLTVLDLSAVPAEWRALAYAEITRTLLAQTDGGLALALLYPDHHLTDLADWVQRAEASEATLILLPSHTIAPSLSELLQEIAANRLIASHGAIRLKGTLTNDLPVTLQSFERTETLLPAIRPQQGVTQESIAQPAQVPEFVDFESEPVAYEPQQEVIYPTADTLQLKPLFPESLYAQHAPGAPPPHAQMESAPVSEESSDSQQTQPTASNVSPDLPGEAFPENPGHADFVSLEMIESGAMPLWIPPEHLADAAIQPDAYPFPGRHAQAQPEDLPPEALQSSALAPVGSEPVPVASVPDNSPSLRQRMVTPEDFAPPQVRHDTISDTTFQESISQLPSPEEALPGAEIPEAIHASANAQADEPHFAALPEAEAIQPGSSQAPLPEAMAWLETSDENETGSPADEPHFDLHGGQPHLSDAQPSIHPQSPTEPAVQDEFDFDSGLYGIAGTPAITLQSHQPPHPSHATSALPSGIASPLEWLEDTLPQTQASTPVAAGSGEDIDLMAPASGWKQTDDVPVYRKPVSAEVGPKPYTVGERVHHAVYGGGVITKVLPMDESLILNITFDSMGKRLLDPALAKLTRESDEE